MPKIMLNSVEYTGGGGDSGMELTYDEYLALPEEEKNNGTTYYVKDINGDGQNFQPVIYSTDEREIGVWTDGRPLYEKTVTFTNISRTGVIDLDLINVDNIFIHNGQYNQDLPLPYVHSEMSNGIGGFFGTDSNGKRIWNVRGGSYAPSVTGWMTVRYTKTTDQPGSSTWTPQGVPAVHYDGNEKVVGTWFGETLYEKTITPSSVTIGNNTIAHGISNAGKLIHADGRAFAGSLNYINIPNVSSSLSYLTNIYGFDSTNIHVEIGSAYHDSLSLSDIAITIRYTKTTS